MSSSQRPQPSPGWPVCATHAAPRRTADAATNMSLTILVGFAMHGPLLFLCCSRPAFKKDRCHSFSTGDPPAGPVLCRTFGATRSCLVRLQEIKGARSPRLVVLAVHGSRKRLRRAIGRKVTLHLAHFPLWHDDPWHGQGTSLLFHRCQSSLFSTETVWSNRTSVKVSFPRSPPDSTTPWVFQNV